MKLWMPPLLVLPLVLYNLVAFGLLGSFGDWGAHIFQLKMVSGGVWVLTLADVLVVLALVLLFVEVLKSTRTGTSSIIDHMASTVVFVVYLVEFLVVPAAATSLFFTCMAMSFIDTVAGFSVSIRAAGRDVNWG